MTIDKILLRCLEGEPISLEEAYRLYEDAPLADLASVAGERRRRITGNANIVTWQIDRNVNITNVCNSGCKFCNFHVKPHEKDKHFVTTIEEYRPKIEQMFEKGGDQLLLQGGHHPRLDIRFYEELFRGLKAEFPKLKLHALGAPEVAHIAKISGLSTLATLERLRLAGLDSLPGAGAEILVDEVRRRVSPNKPSAEEWLKVMGEAHQMNLPTSATMMYGHLETPRQRVEHLFKLRDLQAKVPAGNWGFIAFIPWICHTRGTRLEREGIASSPSALEYLRLIALSRLILYNIKNIQASWLTMGIPTAQIALHSGANDFGSIMIEENVVSSAGASFHLDSEGMQRVIKEAGFEPRLRNQLYEFRD